jgi:hypothetical protein
MMANELQTRPIRPLAALTAIAAVALSACFNESGGTPIPSTSSPGISVPATSSGPSANIFGDLQACDVLDEALRGQGFAPAVVDKAGGDNGCDTSKPAFGGASLNLHPDLGIDDLNADPSKQYPGKINGRRSIQARDVVGSEGGCSIAMEVTNTSRAFLVVVLATGTTNEACAFATEVAKKVEPQLPKGN